MVTDEMAERVDWRTALIGWEHSVDRWAAFWLGRSLWLVNRYTGWRWPLGLGYAISGALGWLAKAYAETPAPLSHTGVDHG